MALERRMFSALDLRHVAGIIVRLGKLPGVPTTDWCLRLADAFVLPKSGMEMEVRAGLFVIDQEGRACPDDSCRVGGAGPAPAHELLGREYDQFVSDMQRVFSRSQNATPRLLIKARSQPSLYGILPTDESPTREQLAIEFRFLTQAPLERAAPLLESVLPHLKARVCFAFESIGGVKPEIASPAEHRVLEHIILGLSVREIAETLDRSPHTIHDHMKSLHRKFQARSRGQLIARALGHGSHAVGTCAEDA